jgi:hypothetical protein
MNANDPFLARAMSATIIVPSGFDSVADYLAAAMFALRRQGMNRALKGVVVMGNSVYHYLQGFIILVSANFTLIHKTSPFPAAIRLQARV